MEICQTIEQMRTARRRLADPVVLVPTMGALHEGHLAHIHEARRQVPHASIIVSIFVNPTQFGPSEDFEHYPRSLDDDLTRCRERAVDAVFSPEPSHIYPPGQIEASVDVPGLTREFEAEQRPDHFPGVCRVVLKLLNITQPTHLTFGQKDYQQLLVCQAMLKDLALPTTVIRVPTVRESDGLARSSRNRYLDSTQRSQALGLIHALERARHLIEDQGHNDSPGVESAMQQTIQASGLQLDYAALRHPATLEPVTNLTNPIVALVAARLGQVRLLDNMLINPALEI